MFSRFKKSKDIWDEKKMSFFSLDRDPYDLVMDLYNSFDYEKIEFTAEYYNTLGL